jgi:hypothetical protein
MQAVRDPVPVRVSELPAVLPRVSRVALEHGEARIQLWPPDLGRIRVHVRVEDGRVTARLFAERDEVRPLLDGMREALEKGLRDSGLRLERLAVDGVLPAQERASAPRSEGAPAPFGRGESGFPTGGSTGSGGRAFARHHDAPSGGTIVSEARREGRGEVAEGKRQVRGVVDAWA